MTVLRAIQTKKGWASAKSPRITYGPSESDDCGGKGMPGRWWGRCIMNRGRGNEGDEQRCREESNIRR